MKKTLSVILSVLMLLCAVPLFASAANGTFEHNTIIQSSDYFQSGTNYTVNDGIKLTIDAGTTAYLPAGSILTVNEGGKLVINGSLVMLPGSQVIIKGDLTGSDKLIKSENVNDEDCLVYYTFATPSAYGFQYETSTHAVYDRVVIKYAFSDVNTADVKTLTFYDVNDAVGAAIPLNSYVYIQAHIIDRTEDEFENGLAADNYYKTVGEGFLGKIGSVLNSIGGENIYDIYDDALLDVYVNNVGVVYNGGAHVIHATTGSNVTYKRWTKPADFYSTFKIVLPYGEGYEVVGRNGETGDSDHAVYLKYGQRFSFKVNIDEDYDMSSYKVYAYDGYGWAGIDTTQSLLTVANLEPDEYGYYNINTVKNNMTVQVVGVTKNETLTLIGEILATIQNFIQMIKEFFASFADIFGNIGG